MGALGPGDIADGTGQTPASDEVGDGEVFQTEPVVGLDQLAGDLVGRKCRRTSAMRACCRDKRRTALARLRERGRVAERDETAGVGAPCRAEAA
jgi:hypothetical protein